MASKTISITEEVYDELTKAKSLDQSFSQEIKSLLARKGRLTECAGLWSWMSAKEAEEIKTAISKSKEYSRKRWKQRINEAWA